jgi:hypothetical protein
MRRFLAGKVSVVEDRKMDGYYEEGEKYRNKRNYVPLVRPTSPSYVLRPPRTSWGRCGVIWRGRLGVVEDMRDGHYEEGEE